MYGENQRLVPPGRVRVRESVDADVKVEIGEQVVSVGDIETVEPAEHPQLRTQEMARLIDELRTSIRGRLALRDVRSEPRMRAFEWNRVRKRIVMEVLPVAAPAIVGVPGVGVGEHRKRGGHIVRGGTHNERDEEVISVRVLAPGRVEPGGRIGGDLELEGCWPLRALHQPVLRNLPLLGVQGLVHPADALVVLDGLARFHPSQLDVLHPELVALHDL